MVYTVTVKVGMAREWVCKRRKGFSHNPQSAAECHYKPRMGNPLPAEDVEGNLVTLQLL